MRRVHSALVDSTHRCAALISPLTPSRVPLADARTRAPMEGSLSVTVCDTLADASRASIISAVDAGGGSTRCLVVCFDNTTDCQVNELELHRVSHAEFYLPRTFGANSRPRRMRPLGIYLVSLRIPSMTAMWQPRCPERPAFLCVVATHSPTGALTSAQHS